MNWSSLNSCENFSFHQRSLSNLKGSRGRNTILNDCSVEIYYIYHGSRYAKLLFYYLIVKIIMFKDFGYDGLCII